MMVFEIYKLLSSTNFCKMILSNVGKALLLQHGDLYVTSEAMWSSSLLPWIFISFWMRLRSCFF